MNRTLTSVKLDDKSVRHRVRIESDPCETPLLKKQHQLMLLDNFATNPSLTDCGPVPFQKMVMQHNGTLWVVELEATVQEQG